MNDAHRSQSTIRGKEISCFLKLLSSNNFVDDIKIEIGKNFPLKFFGFITFRATGSKTIIFLKFQGQ